MTTVPHISNEDELMTHLIKLHYWSGFPKVTQISTLKLSPDIDFLQIDDYNKVVTGFEFKLIKYHKGLRRANLTPFYTGIGEALHYFQFGIDRSCLVLGLSKDIPQRSLDTASSKISELASTFISFKTFNNLRCFGVKVWSEATNFTSDLLEATDNFNMTDNAKHLKNCLLLQQFKYDRKFQERYLGK